MTRRVADIAEELGISEDEVRKIIASLNLRVGKTASKINDDVARLTVAKAKGDVIEDEKGKQVIKEEVEKNEADSSPKNVQLPVSLTVKELGEILHVKVTTVISALIQNGVLATINDVIDYETAAIVSADLGFETEEKEEEDLGVVESDQLKGILANEEEGTLIDRPPVISVIGHVDHGKTKLLDAIRGTDVVAGEAGGITQKIGAYQVERNGKKITFIDTPGHEAFSAMRARGVKSTDIAILVIAADDGVKPQTIEALNHAKAAEVPVVVAINKVDKPEANVGKVKQQLTEHDILVEEYGGKTVCAEVSAKTGQGIDELLDMVLLVADMEDLKANPERDAIGSVIESRLDTNLGPVATVLVHTGTLKKRDSVVIGSAYGRVKILIDHHGKSVDSVAPSSPVLLAGLSRVPRAGDLLQVMKSEQAARNAAERVGDTRKTESQKRKLVHTERAKSDDDDSLMMSEYNVVIKGDLRGSLEAIKGSLESLLSETVKLKIVHMAVGDVTDSDLLLASAAGADIYAFNVRVPVSMVRRADIEGIKLKSYNVIYQLVDEVESHLNALMEPEKIETEIGRMKVLKVFFSGKNERVVGGDVTKGFVRPNTHARIYRDDALIGEGEINEVKQGPETTQESKQGEQCGVRYLGPVRVMEGDIIEINSIEMRQRSVKRGTAEEIAANEEAAIKKAEEKAAKKKAEEEDTDKKKDKED